MVSALMKLVKEMTFNNSANKKDTRLQIPMRAQKEDYKGALGKRLIQGQPDLDEVPGKASQSR